MAMLPQDVGVYRRGVFQLSSLTDPQAWAQGLNNDAARVITKVLKENFPEGKPTPPANVIKFNEPEPMAPPSSLLVNQQSTEPAPAPATDEETKRRNLDFILHGKL